jgi:hypothetical protein
MPTSSRRRTCTDKRRIMSYSNDTRSHSGGWRRRHWKSSNNVRLVCSMLAIISKIHLSLVVDDSLDVGGINHILCSMIKPMHKLSPKEGTEAQRRLIIRNS